MSTIRNAAPALLAALLALTHAPAPAQTADLVPGDVVRVSSTTADPQVATVLRVADGVLMLSPSVGAETLDIPLSTVTRVEVNRGRRPAGAGLVRGAGFGLLVGAAAGAVAGAVAYEEPDRSTCTGEGWENMFCNLHFGPQSPGESAAWGAAGGAMLGVVVGAVAGLVRPGTRWERMELGGARVTAAAGAGGAGIRVTLPL